MGPKHSSRLRLAPDFSLFATALILLILFTTLLAPMSSFAFGKDQANAGASSPEARNPMTAKARFQPSRIEAGGTAELLIEMTLAPHFHAYGDRFKIAIESPDDLKIDDYRVAPLSDFKDSVSKSMKKGVQGQATLRAHVEVPLGFKANTYTPMIKLTFQACTDAYCLFPKSIEIQAPIEIIGPTLANAPVAAPAIIPAVATVSESQASAATTSDVTPNSNLDIKATVEKSLFSALVLMFIVGFLTSLTPCVYPMIPITLAVLGVRAPKNGQKPSHWRSFSIALVYVLGLCVTYSTLGVIAASTGGLFGSALSNVYVVTVIALLFVAMGLSMYGLFEVQAPAFIRNRLGGSAAQPGGYAGAFVTGLVAGVIASPCIGPVLVGVLAFIAQTQNRLLGFSLLFSFSLGMGMLFIVLGVFGSLLGRLPRAGSWMDSVKYIFGTVMIGMAFYYIKPIYPVWLFTTLLGFAGILLASFYGAFDPLTDLTPKHRLLKGIMLSVFFFGVAFAVSGLMIRFQLYPQMNGQSVASADTAAGAPVAAVDHPAWIPYTPALFEAALTAGQPVIVDFSAAWCGACNELEERTYPKAAVSALMKKFKTIKVDATESTPDTDAWTQKFGVVGLPTLLFFDAKGKALPALTLTGFEDPEPFAKRLSEALK